MVGKLLRCLLLLYVFEMAMPATAVAGLIQDVGQHRADVDVTRYPWSSVGKLYNETGGSCSGVVVAADKILTAAHCLFNYRSQRFISADALHFLVGYRIGRYAVHARIASYEVGEGFDPLRYGETSNADWAVLTATKRLPVGIEPLKLSDSLVPRGTKAILVGYPQDRAFAMTADRNCELRDEVDGGQFLLHTCRGIKGYSGAPILVSAGSGDVQIAGIQIAAFRAGGIDRAVALPAQAIRRQGRDVFSGSTSQRQAALQDGVQTATEFEAPPIKDMAGAWDEAGFEIDTAFFDPAKWDQLTVNEVASLEFGLFGTMTP